MKKTKAGARVTVPVSMDGKMEERIDEAARRVGLSKQATMRLSIERGLDILISQLTGSAAAQ